MKITLAQEKDTQISGHLINYYKSNNSIGIKIKATGQQIFSSGGKKCKWSEKELRTLAAEAVKLLDGGETKANAQQYAKNKIAKSSDSTVETTSADTPAPSSASEGQRG